jgi:hypothetical protein
VVEAGKNERRHDDVSEEVTAPAGVIVVRIMQGFHLALPSTPTPSDALQGVTFGITNREKQAGDVVADVHARFYFCRQCWASKCRDL